MMREIDVDKIIKAVCDLSIQANTDLGEDVLAAFDRALETEVSPIGRDILKRLVENAQIAKKDHIPMCQDTGMAVVYIEIGQEVHVTGGSLKDAIDEGVRQGYQKGYLRKSLCDPVTRKNTGDNTPAMIHYDIVPGQGFKLTVAPKGGGGENMSRVTMLSPSDGMEGVKDFVVQRVKAAGGKPCPPIIVGVGIGGTLEKTALLAKQSLLRQVGSPNPDPNLDALEKLWLDAINRLGIGPQGLGGRTTALAVHINAMACHIASIPVAINIQCHSSRHKEMAL
jgi:fumarate hydratase subunit alpha